MCTKGDETILALPPFLARYRENKETVCVDSCIVKPIQYLWDHGEHTLACCCGHRECFPNIVLSDGYDLSEIRRMRGLLAEVDDRDWTIYLWRLTEMKEEEGCV